MFEHSFTGGIVTALENCPGLSGPDSAMLTLRDGRFIEIGDEGLNVWRSLHHFEHHNIDGPEHSITFNQNPASSNKHPESQL